MKLKAAFAAVAIAITSCIALGQTAPQKPAQPSPEEMKQIMQASMGAMVSVMGPMTEAMIEAQLATAAKPETAERVATFKKNLYDALIKKGFKPQDALQMVISTSMPGAMPGAK
jgi:hypothetical protein